MSKGATGQVRGTSHRRVCVAREQQLCPGDVCPHLLCALGTVLLSLKVAWALKDAFKLSAASLTSG